MKKEIRLLSYLMLLLVLVSACSKKNDIINIDSELESTFDLKSAKIKAPEVIYTVTEESAGIVLDTTLNFLAGQHIDAGDVLLGVVDDNLIITIQMNSDWLLNCTHIFVGDYADIPLNKKGNPQLGHFPISDCFKKGTEVVTYQIPTEGMADEVSILIHGDVSSGKQSETAWALGTDIEEATRWGWYNNYVVEIPIVR